MICWEKCHLLSCWRTLSQCTAGRWSLSVGASFNDTYIKLFTLSEGLLLAGSLEWVQSGEPRPVVIGPYSVRAIHALHDGELSGLFGLTNAGLSGRWLPVNFPVKKSSGLSDGVWMHFVQVRRPARNISSSEQWVCVWWHSQSLPVLWLCRIFKYLLLKTKLILLSNASSWYEGV